MCKNEHKLFAEKIIYQTTSVQYGRSMVEMLGVLAIIGVLSVGGIAGYSKAMTKYKINKTIEQISHTVANVQTMYAQQTSYSGLFETARLENSPILLTDMFSFSNRTWLGISNEFGGDFLVSESGIKYFYVGVTNIPKEACVALATYDWGNTSSSG